MYRTAQWSKYSCLRLFKIISAVYNSTAYTSTALFCFTFSPATGKTRETLRAALNYQVKSIGRLLYKCDYYTASLEVKGDISQEGV